MREESDGGQTLGVGGRSGLDHRGQELSGAPARELVRPAERVLDFACGTGYGTSVLAAGPAAWITGVDCSAAAIAFARQRWSAANIEYVQASAGSYAFPEAAFDLVVALEIVEHVANDRALVDRLWRTVKPGGRLVFSVPDLARYPIANHPFHVRHYSERSVSRLLAGLAGLGFTCLLGEEGAARMDRGAAGKHLVAVAEKTGAGGGESTAARLEAILPFTEVEVEVQGLRAELPVPRAPRVPRRRGARDEDGVGHRPAPGVDTGLPGA